MKGPVTVRATRREVAFNIVSRLMLPLIAGVVLSLSTDQAGWTLVGLFVGAVILVVWLLATDSTR
ncbi:MAG: hypothetical protein JWO37_2435 [Acidimicrobiales bacterium]|jgi:hypothetical protein|nr:hypothetical protein [Acidimicrobiales bacterium]